MVMTMERNQAADELEVTARLAGEKVDTKQICEKWLLITYDMPHSEAGDKARREFLLQARRLGAAQHTESVYLLPYSAAAGEAVLELCKAGKVIVWTSEVTNPGMAELITHNYDVELGDMLKKLAKRVDHMIELRKENKLGILNKMREKTDTEMAAMGDAVRRRESLDLAIRFKAIEARYQYT